MSRVIVVGAGPAGCIAAISAAQNGHRVVLCEKNEKIGKKLFITGKGRCNITNAADMPELFGNIVSNEKFLYSAFYGFDNNCVCSFMKQGGCPVKTERGGRVFPVSDHSSDVIRALWQHLKQSGVEVLLHTEVEQLCWQEQKAQGTDQACNQEDDQGRNEKNSADRKITGVILKGGQKKEADAVIIATGGFSYQTTGSTGDGYRFAKQLGITVTERKPALVPFELAQDYGKRLQGLALKNVKASLLFEGRQVYQEMGEMLFTHFGISGPLVLSASSYYAKRAGKGTAVFRLDLKPALSEEQLDKRILRDFEKNQKKQFKNAVGGLFPSRLIPVMIEVSGIDPEKKIQDITREERRRFVSRIKNWDMLITGTRDFQEAIITQGGVSTREVNPSTMECRKVKGLYFAGEVLDVDALTGGFNLQIAWSTGHLAGESVKEMKIF